jgi:predicted MFS family arabinose efflux permease
MAVGGDGSLPARPNKWIALTVVCLIVFVICINTTAINTAVATMADDLALSTSTLGWVSTFTCWLRRRSWCSAVR